MIEILLLQIHPNCFLIASVTERQDFFSIFETEIKIGQT